MSFRFCERTKTQFSESLPQDPACCLSVKARGSTRSVLRVQVRLTRVGAVGLGWGQGDEDGSERSSFTDDGDKRNGTQSRTLVEKYERDFWAHLFILPESYPGVRGGESHRQGLGVIFSSSRIGYITA